MSRSVPPYRCTSEMLKQADRRFVFSRFRYWKSFAEEDETFTCCNFSNDDEYIQIGNFTGDVFCYNIRTGQHISTSNCHHSYLTSIQQSKNGKLMLTSSGLMPPLSTLWRMGPQNEPQEPLIEFPEETYVDFGHNRSSHHLVGTMRSKATVYDTETGMPIVRLYDETLANGYERNRACFDPYDELVLNDGILFDPRVGSTGRVVHKFDKLNSDISGLFHPKGSEVIINSEVWDLRTYRLLHTVPALNQCKVMFNSTANIIFGDVSDDFEPRFNAVYNSSFRTLDAGNYQVITTMDTKKQLHDFCPDHSDNFVALIEANPIMRDPNLCKLYEVGRGREPDEEDEDEDIDEEDDDEEGDDQNDDELIDFGNTTDDDSEIDDKIATHYYNEKDMAAAIQAFKRKRFCSQWLKKIENNIKMFRLNIKLLIEHLGNTISSQERQSLYDKKCTPNGPMTLEANASFVEEEIESGVDKMTDSDETLLAEIKLYLLCTRKTRRIKSTQQDGYKNLNRTTAVDSKNGQSSSKCDKAWK
ncbi:DDB1- and CUL4-associated factor 1 [Ditylenchus destructor]|nr:DDB1- and CUL4-associated factor 1 [Ditylenchus destructor]